MTDTKQLAGLLREAAAELRLAIHYDYDDPEDQPPERLDAAADELEAEGVEPVAVVIDNVVGVSIAWCKGPSEGRPPPGTRLYTTPAPAVSEGGTSVSVPDGYVLVPVEPTDDMKAVFDDMHTRPYHPASTYRCEHTWKAVIAAAPQPGES